MTDTVNVPRERIEAFLTEWGRRHGVVDIIYSMGTEGAVLELAVSDLRTLLAAAPKAEPVSASYKLGCDDALAAAVAVIKRNTPEAAGGPMSHTNSVRVAMIDVLRGIEALSAQPLSNPQQLPEAPKVEQKPVICQHEAYQGSCAHCGIKIVNGFAVTPKASQVPKAEKRSVGWDHKYRQLEKGEIILASDEVQHDDGSWHPSASVGQEAPDPSYTSHRVYRRLKHPAPASDELLEAIAKDASERVHKNGGCVPQLAYAPILFALQDGFAKHKGPQS